jgi:hypothetical protein
VCKTRQDAITETRQDENAVIHKKARHKKNNYMAHNGVYRIADHNMDDKKGKFRCYTFSDSRRFPDSTISSYL